MYIVLCRTGRLYCIYRSLCVHCAVPLYTNQWGVEYDTGESSGWVSDYLQSVVGVMEFSLMCVVPDNYKDSIKSVPAKMKYKRKSEKHLF